MSRAAGDLQAAFFDGDIAQVIAEQERIDAERRAARERSLEARRAVLMADTAAWKGGPFAERAEALLSKLAALGEPGKGMHDIILIGINDAAKAGRLDEQRVRFLEDKARQEVARVGAIGQVVPTTWRDRDAADLEKMGAGCLQLPVEIQSAGLNKINHLGQDLAKLGFQHTEEVDSRATQEARVLAQDIRDVFSSLVLLSAARYFAVKDYKNLNPTRLDRMENFASATCGIDTRAFPGIKMDIPLTADGQRKASEGRAPRRSVGLDERVSSAATADIANGMYIGKVVSVTDFEVVQKYGRGPADLVKHTLALLAGAEGLEAGEVVTIAYAMGAGEVSGRNRGVERAGVDR